MIARSRVPLAPLTTLQIGGPAARMADLDREADVVDAVRDADAAGDPLLVLGEGSNVVVLSPDVAEVFPNSASVNEALRTLIRIARQSSQKS